MTELPLWAQNLDRWRLLRGMTTEELSDAADVNLKSLYGYLKGEVHNPRGDTLQRLADALGTTEEELRFGSPQPSALKPNGIHADSISSDERGTSVGARIHAERKRLGLKQAELARLVGVTRQSVHAWEKGMQIPARTLVSLLCTTLQLPPSALDPYYVAMEQAEERKTLRTNECALERIQAILGLSPLHDVVESVRLLYEHGREAFEAQRGPRYPHNPTR
ncbi:MAG: helix-turn-helix domain-containing protein [Burkholderiaceae bacterium]|nr:helix-turn-helix domain-containing protein [Burkholderiaceae bacterium]